MKKKYGFWNFVIDMFLGFITGGIWFIWLIVKFLRKNS